MKKYILLTLVLCLLPVCALAQQVLAADHITLEEALSQLEPSADPVSQMLYQRLAPLQQCEGRFVQPAEPDEKHYTADVSFYLQKGEVYTRVDYTNYSGTLDDAPLTPVQDGEYLYQSAPKGHFFGQEQDFEILFAPGQLRIQWGEGTCDYVLYRGDGTERTDDPPFVETDTYQTFVDAIDRNFQQYPHSIQCDEAQKTIRVYVAMGAGMKAGILARAGEMHQSWQTIVDGIQPFCKNMYAAVELALRDGIVDIRPAYFIFSIVETLQPNDQYGENEILCTVENGRVTYDLLSGVFTAPSKPGSPPADATFGQQNALRRAKDYLDIFSFSYDGLVGQLEYDGFTLTEARYGADWCGANWYAQAVEKAQSYLELHAFSRQGLIEQLEFDEFTHDQALYAVGQCGY